MSGTAFETGDAATGTGTLATIANIFDGLNLIFGTAPTADPVQPIEPAPVSNPDRESTFQLAGLGVGTLALLAIGIIVAVKLLK